MAHGPSDMFLMTSFLIGTLLLAWALQLYIQRPCTFPDVKASYHKCVIHKCSWVRCEAALSILLAIFLSGNHLLNLGFHVFVEGQLRLVDIPNEIQPALFLSFPVSPSVQPHAKYVTE